MTDVLHRPLGLGQVFELSLRVYRARFWPYFLLFFAANGIMYVMVKVPQVVFLTPAMRGAKVEGMMGAMAAVWGAALVGILFLAIANNLLMAFVTLQVEHLYAGQNLSGRAAAARLTQVAVPLLLTLLMSAVLTGVGFMLCLIPGLILLPRLAFVAPVFLMEDFRYSEGIHRSWLLTAYRTGAEWTSATYWRVSGVLLAGVILGYVVGLLFQFPFMIVAVAQEFWKLGQGRGGAPSPPMLSGAYLAWSTLGEVAGLAGRALVQPHIIIATVLLYLDTRNRRDGLGLLFRARSLRAGR